MESVSGKDLSTFFEQWLYRSSHPKIEGEAHVDKSDKKLTLHIRQVQQDAPYQLPLDIKVYLCGWHFPDSSDTFIPIGTDVFLFNPMSSGQNRTGS